jgi:hypothetical protein
MGNARKRDGVGVKPRDVGPLPPRSVSTCNDQLVALPTLSPSVLGASLLLYQTPLEVGLSGVDDLMLPSQ